MPKAVRLVTFAWGEQHVKDMLNYALASAMAPGNLPAIARHFDCTVAVVTEASLFDLVRESETGRRIQEVCTLKLIALDDLLAESWQYGMTLTRALFRGMEDLGPAMAETYFLFLNADFIISNGCYERLVPRIQAGERLHLSPSYCTVEEVVGPILLDRLDNGVLDLAPRDLAGLILKHRHNTIKAKTVNQDTIEFEHADQFYWAVDQTTLLGHQMPIAVVGMQPTVALTDVGTFWDWGLIYDFCPDKPFRVIGDSDEFVMLEMRPRMRSAENILLGRSSPRAVAKRMTGYITQYQVDNAKFPLTLHSEDIPAGVPSARSQLKAYVDTVLRNLPSKPIDHSNHAQWRYHTKYFRQRLAKRYLGFYRPRKGAKPIFRPITFEEPSRSRKAALVRQLVDVGHPYRELIGKLKERPASPYPSHILAVCERGSALLKFLDGLPGLQTHLTPDLVLDGALAFWPEEVSKFDLCLVEAPSGDAAGRATELVETILSHVPANGTISLLWYAGSGANQKPLMTAAVAAMSQRKADVEFHCQASPLASLGQQGMRLAYHNARLGKLGRILRAPALLASTALLVFARLLGNAGLGRRLGKSNRPPGSDCVGLVINLKPLPPSRQEPKSVYLSKRQAASSRQPADEGLFHNADPKFTKWIVKTRALEKEFALVAIGAEERSIARFHVLEGRLRVHRLGRGLPADVPKAAPLLQTTSGEYVQSFGASQEMSLGPFGESSVIEKSKRPKLGPLSGLEKYLRSGAIPALDFLNISANTGELGTFEELDPVVSSGLLGLELSIESTGIHARPAEALRLKHLGGAAQVLESHGLRLHDINFDRFIRPRYVAARTQLYAAGPDFGAGTPSAFNLLFCRELPQPSKSSRRTKVEEAEFLDRLIKLMIVCELYGVKDAAVETLLAYMERLDRRIDVDKALTLLCA